jgi:hypothetical protein
VQSFGLAGLKTCNGLKLFIHICTNQIENSIIFSELDFGNTTWCVLKPQPALSSTIEQFSVEAHVPELICNLRCSSAQRPSIAVSPGALPAFARCWKSISATSARPFSFNPRI